MWSTRIGRIGSDNERPEFFFVWFTKVTSAAVPGGRRLTVVVVVTLFLLLLWFATSVCLNEANWSSWREVEKARGETTSSAVFWWLKWRQSMRDTLWFCYPSRRRTSSSIPRGEPTRLIWRLTKCHQPLIFVLNHSLVFHLFIHSFQCWKNTN